MTTVPVRRHNHVRRLASDRAFDGVLYTIAAILTLTALYPMYFIIIASISDPSLVAQGKILLLPRGVTLEGYEHLASMKNLWVGYGNTILYTIAGTAIMLVVNIPVAYALSRRDLVGRRWFTLFFVFPMFFGVQPSRAGTYMGLNKDGEAYFVPAAENYKEAVKWAHELYVSGALDPERFTQTADMVSAKIQEDGNPRTGIVFGWTADAELLGNAKDYVVVEAVTGPDGEHYVESDPTYLNYGRNEFVVTKNCKDVGKLLTWADQFYTDVASLQTYYGSIDDGKIQANADGTYEVLLPDADSGINLDTSCWTFSFRDHGPKYMHEGFQSKIILPTTEGDGIKLADDAVNAAYVRDTFPVVFYTTEQLEEKAFLATDIISYISSQYAHWVKDGGVEEEWDAYLKKLDEMGLQSYVQIEKDAFAAYQGK